jgi:NAD(P)H-nitrite reductase large subunit
MAIYYNKDKNAIRPSGPSIHHVVVGNSAAAISAIKAIRENDPQSKITLISAEDCYAYSPVLLTYYMAGKISRSQVFLTDSNYYREFGVTLKLGGKVEDIDLQNSRVILANGDRISYDHLLIATGSSAKRLGVDGDLLPGVFTLKTLSDADNILSYLLFKKRIAIIGGGLIGLQAANALTGMQRHITLIVGSNQPLSQNVDGECSQFITDSIKNSGLSIRFDTRAVRITKDHKQLEIHLNTGESLAVDAAIVGKGIVPNAGLAKKAGIKVNRGIVVDPRMRTDYQNIYAAGDVAEGLNQTTGERQVVATWVNACAQGRAAGVNMSGGKVTYTGLNCNVCSILGKSVASVGVTKPSPDQHRSKTFTHPSGIFYRNIIFNENDEIAGAVMMGQVSDIGLIRNMIIKRVKVPDRLKDRIVRAPISYGLIYNCSVLQK